MISAVLFDLDGVLLDTAEGSIESFDYACRQMGFNILTYEEKKKIIGPPIKLSFKALCSCSEAESKQASVIFREYYKDFALFKAYPYEGILSVLEELKARGFKIGVATYKREDYAIKLLDYFGISQYCDIVHGADAECQRTKANIVNLCIEALKVPKKSVVLIGDTVHDSLGAQKVGINFIGVTYGYGFTTTNDIDMFPNIGKISQPRELIKLLIL